MPVPPPSSRAAIARAELAAAAVTALVSESEMAAAHVAELDSSLSARLADANQAAQRARLTAAKVGEARSAVDAAWEAVNAADRAVADAAGEARLALAALAAARGRLSGSAADGGIARAVAAGTLRARRLVDCLQITDDEFAGAVAAALEEHLGAWLVDDLVAAAAHLDRDGPRERLVSAGLDAVIEQPVPEPFVLLSGAVEVLPEAVGAVSRLLHGAWVAPDLDSAQQAFDRGASLAVLRDGTVVTPTGLRGGRAVDTIDLARDERAASLAADRSERLEAAAVATAANARDRLNDLDQALSVAVEADRAARAEEAAAAALAVGAQQALDSAATQTERAATMLIARRAEADAALEAQSAADRQLAAAVERHAGVEGAAGSAEAHARQVRAAAETARSAAEEAELVLSRAKAEGAHVEERREAARRALDAARSRLAAAETRRLIAEGDALAAIVHGLQGRGEAVRAALEQSTAQRAYDLVAQPIVELELAVLALETEHAEVAVAVARAGDELQSAELEVAACEAAVAEHADAVRDLTDDDSIELDPAAAERAEREIVRLERRIAALGAVNALAPEQHEALTARVLTIAAQRDDLARACADLRAMARHLEREIERRFDTVFGAVSFHFQELYAELFPGGKATLRLEEPEPVLDLDGVDATKCGTPARGRDPRPAAGQAPDAAPAAQRRRASPDRARRGPGAPAGEPEPVLRLRRGRRGPRRQQRAPLHQAAPPARRDAAVPRRHPQPHHHGRRRRALGCDHRRRRNEFGAGGSIRRGGGRRFADGGAAQGGRVTSDEVVAPVRRSAWWRRVSGRMDKASSAFGAEMHGLAAPGRKLDDAFFDELTEVLIAADCGVELSERLAAALRERARREKLADGAAAIAALKTEILAVMNTYDRSLNLGAVPSVVLVVGVNGSGKTTTIGKLAYRLREEGRSVAHRRGRHLSSGGDRPDARLGGPSR